MLAPPSIPSTFLGLPVIGSTAVPMVGGSPAEAADKADASGEVRVRMYLDAWMEEGLSGQNGVGVVSGESEEVVVNARLDGWYDGAGDDEDGLAVQET